MKIILRTKFSDNIICRIFGCKIGSNRSNFLEFISNVDILTANKDYKYYRLHINCNRCQKNIPILGLDIHKMKGLINDI